MNEKRKYLRFAVPLRVEMVVEARVDLPQKGITKNFSREGLGLILHDFHLTAGSEVSLRVHVPQKKKPANMKGKITWAKLNNRHWEVGVKTIQINSEDKNQILDYAYKIWRSEESDKNKDKKKT